MTRAEIDANKERIKAEGEVIHHNAGYWERRRQENHAEWMYYYTLEADEERGEIPVIE